MHSIENFEQDQRTSKLIKTAINENFGHFLQLPQLLRFPLLEKLKVTKLRLAIGMEKVNTEAIKEEFHPLWIHAKKSFNFVIMIQFSVTQEVGILPTQIP